MLIRRLLVLCAMGAFLASSPAWAACTTPTTISGATKKALETSADGCDITIGPGGSVSINSSGAAVTIDSNNTVTNNGKISNAAAANAIGVLLKGGGAASGFIDGGGIDVEGKKATGGIGIEVDPSGYTGDITLQTAAATVTVTGDGSTGLAVFGPLVGNVILNGTILVTGADATGVLIEAPVTGGITNSGTIDARGITTLSTTKTNPEAGSALAVGGSVSGGIYNVGPDSIQTLAAFAVIETQGSSPAIDISPALAGTNAANLTIGVVIDPDKLENSYSFLNRGAIIANGADPGVDATAILIGGDTSFTTTLTDGIFNSDQILAKATTGDQPKNAKTADSVGIEIGTGGTVPDILNAGDIEAETIGLAGGQATAVLIDAGGSLPSLDNSGRILATAAEISTGTVTGLQLTACAICDESGTLTSLINSGSIIADAGTVVTVQNGTTTNTTYNTNDGNIITAIAVDMSHVAAGTDVTFQNTGTVIGDVLFGASNNTLDDQGAGTIVGNVDMGGGSSTLNITGIATGTIPTALVDGVITYDPGSGGTLAINVGANGELRTSSAEATTLNVQQGGTVSFVLGGTAPAPGTGIVTTTGATTFAAGSNITFGFDASLPDTGNYALVYAAGGLNFSGGLNTVNFYGLPYLYTLVSLSEPDPNELVIDFQRKTGTCASGQDPKTCLNLAGNEAAIYGVGSASPVMAAARKDAAFGAALMNLGTQSAVDSALNSLLPDLSNDTRAIAIALTDQATGAVGARQRTLTQYANAQSNIEVWGQEFASLLSDDNSANGAGYAGRGFGFATGADGGSPASGRFGGAFTFFAGLTDEAAPRSSKTNLEWYMLSLYSDWRGRVLFFNTQANAGYGTFTGERTIDIGGLNRKAQGVWSDYLASGGFSTGLIFGSSPGFTVMPEFNVDGLFVRENAYGETGAMGEDLSLQAHDQESLRGFLGVVMRDNISLEDGVLQPEIRGGWSHDFLNDPETVTAAFAAAPGLNFTLTGPASSPSRFVGGTSLSWVYRSWSLGLNYDITASSGAFTHSGTLTLTGHI